MDPLAKPSWVDEGLSELAQLMLMFANRLADYQKVPIRWLLFS